MKTLSTYSAESAPSLLDYQVVDKAGSEIGTVHSFWADAQGGKLEFVGVKTGWLFGHNHVVPVEKVELDEANKTVRVPYEEEFVKGAPSFDADATISDEQEEEIFRYYGVRGGGYAQESITGATSRPATSTVATGTALAAAATAGTSGVTAQTKQTTTDNDTIEVPLTEEQVKVGKRTVEAGSVRLRKIVRTEIVNQPVEIRHEDVVVERVSADQVHAGTATTDFKEETIDVPLTREEVVVAKEAHVTSAVRLHKTAESETQNVSETVRKEDVEVLRDGKTVEKSDSTTRR